MHGSGLTHIVWSLHEQFFATKGYSILSVDLPGHGSSEGPAIKSIEGISQCIKKSIEKFKIIRRIPSELVKVFTIGILDILKNQFSSLAFFLSSNF